MNKLLFHQNGFTRTSLSATLTQVILLRKMCVCGVFLHRQGSCPSGFSHSMPNSTGKICQLQCTQHVQSIEQRL